LEMERPVGGISHMGQTYIKVKGVCKYRYRAVGKQCKIVDLLLKATRDIAAAKRVVGKAMELTAIRTRSRWARAAPTATIDAINAGRAVPPLVRHSHTSITSSNRITAPSSG
jgi:putative transposase